MLTTMASASQHHRQFQSDKSPKGRGSEAGRLVVIFAALLLATPNDAANAQGDFLPVPTLSAVFPQGAQVGTTTEVTLTGEHLDGPANLVFTKPSIDCRPKLDDHGKPVPNSFVIQLPSDIASKAYDVRLRGKFGLSNPRQWIVGLLPEVNHEKAATEREKATEIAINSTINTSTVAGARSWFTFHSQAKQRLYIHIDVPDSRVEPNLAVADPDGRIVMRGRAPTKAFELNTSRDGAYSIEIHDLLYRGGNEFRYRMSVATEPVLSTNNDSLATAFMDDAELDRINRKAFENADPSPRDQVLPTPVEKAVEYLGLFPPRGQAATFLITLKANDVFWVEVWSHRLGHSTDASLVVDRIQKSSDGNETLVFVDEARDILHSASATGFELDSRDGTLRIEAAEEGAYRISLRDIFNTGLESPRSPYRLIVRKAKPNFELIAVPDQGPRNRPLPTSAYLLPPTLRRGGVAAVRVFVGRQDGFAGEVRLNAVNLPDGVTCLDAIVGQGDECASLTFYASEEAPPWSEFIQVQGQAVLDGKEETRIAKTGTQIWNVRDTRQDRFQARRTDCIGLAVVAEDAPMLLEPEFGEVIEAKPKDKISLKLKVTRRGGYDGIVNVRPFVLGDQEKSVRSDHSIPNGVSTTVIELDLSKFDVKPGEHSFVIHGYADKVKYVKSVDENKDAKPKEMSFALFSKPIRIKILADLEKK